MKAIISVIMDNYEKDVIIRALELYSFTYPKTEEGELAWIMKKRLSEMKGKEPTKVEDVRLCTQNQ